MASVPFNWASGSPLDADLVSSGASEIRSERTNLQKVLDAEHHFPEGGGNGGAHRKGSARVFVGPSSQVSSSDTDGRLMWNSTNSTLVYLSSTASQVIGGRTPIAPIGGGHIGFQTSGLTQYPGIDCNVTSNITNDSVTVVSFNHAFAVPPIVTLTIRELTPGGDKAYAPEVRGVGTSNFTLYWGGVAPGTSSACSVNWVAVGRVVNP